MSKKFYVDKSIAEGSRKQGYPFLIYQHPPRQAHKGLSYGRGCTVHSGLASEKPGAARNGPCRQNEGINESAHTHARERGTERLYSSRACSMAWAE